MQITIDSKKINRKKEDTVKTGVYSGIALLLRIGHLNVGESNVMNISWVLSNTISA